jgi:pSer/pThr/pTyr-binding forkhead associated (FHA) protein/ribosomal protein L40E
MIVCPNCDHQNPDGATVCEACYTPLPTMTACPHCQASIQVDASFCGQCGSNLEGNVSSGGNNLPLEVALEPTIVPEPSPQVVPTAPEPKPRAVSGVPTQLQSRTARLLHVQTNTYVELPERLSVIHIGKPNGKIPPDIDVSGFPHSDIVSRVHADIRVESDAYYLEDTGSANGTYVNNLPLPTGNRHRLRAGDRIALGKSDLVTFLFQES